MSKDKKAPQFEIINYPALRVDMDTPSDPRAIGEALWPAKYNIDQLNRIKSQLSQTSTRAWSSLYQQSPIRRGGLFTAGMFEFVDLPTHFDYTFTTADTAYTEKEESDFTVFQLGSDHQRPR